MRIARGTRLSYQPGSFLDNERPTSYSPDTPGFYYALLAGVPCQPAGDPISVDHSAFKEKPYTDDSGNITYTLIGQRLANVPNAILSEEEWNKLGKPVDYTKGILRVLGIDGREEGMPSTKKHELFVPYSPSNPRRRIPVPDDVIKQFRSLAKERHTDEEDLPYSLEGYPGWEPQAGQLFFFDVKLENGRPVVSKISISSIWRKAADGSTWDFFSEIDPDLLPWNPKRTKLTPAELMFGVVEDRKASDDEESEEGDDEESGEDIAEEAEAELPPARALASRVRFHDALPLPGQTVGILNHPIMLKILSSPKPPSPALYFHPKNGNQGVFIKKTDLSKDRHHPNGRKVYLHHPQASLVPDASGKYPWETKDDSPKTAEQKLRCTPLQDKQDFFFHIDFDNLTKAELTLLLTSLRPSDSFRHRLGLGKSLGLGTVCVDIEGVFFIDRHKRYGREALSEPRYHKAWRPQPVTAKPDWDPLYPEEAGRLVELSQTGELATGDLKQVKFYSDSLIDRRTLGLLNTVGDPAKLKPNASVHTPLLSSQIDSVHPEKAEQETFQWFVENDRRGRQALPPIASGQPLPVLQTDPPGNPAGQGQNRRRTNRR